MSIISLHSAVRITKRELRAAPQSDSMLGVSIFCLVGLVLSFALMPATEAAAIIWF